MGKTLWKVWVISIWVTLVINVLMATDGFTDTSPDALVTAIVISLFCLLGLILLPKLIFAFFQWFLKRSDIVKRTQGIAETASASVKGAFKSREDRLLGLSDDFFKVAKHEIDSGTQKGGLWAKAFTISEGDENRQKANYMRLRAKQLSEDGSFNLEPSINTHRSYADPMQQANSEEEEEIMSDLGIEYDGKRYWFRTYQYPKLEQAIEHAMRVQKK